MKPKHLISLAVVLLVLIGFTFFYSQKKETAGESPLSETSELKKEDSTVSNTAASPDSSATPTPAKHPELKVLAEIFKTKNDNDPRMDRELKNLSESVKAALRQQYADTKAELRNERGTIAFLLGRELKEGRGSEADVKFLASILMEKPCLSLTDCSKPASSQTPEEQHLEAIHETTAHYPQLMSLRAFRQSLESGNLTPELRRAAIEAIEDALHSRNPRVAQEAQAILASLPKN